MIAETIPEVYDGIGRKVSKLSWNRGACPTFPMGRYMSQPLAIKCQSIHDICQFLKGCRGVSDEDLFGKRDYWQPPEDFEKLKKGDCDDFALWTWRQFLSLGYDARVVFGRFGRFGTGHAWVEYFENNKCYLVEPQRRMLGESMPRLSTLVYTPQFSAAWDGEKLSYYAHKESQRSLNWVRFPGLFFEWVVIWGRFWLKLLPRSPRIARNLFRRLLKSLKRSD